MHERFTRIQNDINGNPRHIVHFTDCEPPEMADQLREQFTILQRYEAAVHSARPHGGRAYRGRAYGGGIVFVAYDFEMAALVNRIRDTRRRISELRQALGKTL